ncbi:MAG: Hsp20/alpha crystallin family protein [Actinomycetota bacterium]|jgi:HSP20 family protein|nr:Hsp20/alpha crystallin family protein [Actinomycetota bacterium]
MMTRHERFPLEWRPERLRRLLDLDFDLADSLRVEEFRDEDHFVITAEAPGLDPAKDVEVTVSDEVLRIRVHRSERTERKNKESYRSEFKYGELVREFALPAGSRAEGVTAAYKDGLLEVRVPLDAERKPEVVSVPVTTG